jgi:hypothetical protein
MALEDRLGEGTIMTLGELAELRKNPNAARLIKIIEGLCLAALDTRSRILCMLSAHDSEWDSDGENLVKLAHFYKDIVQNALELSSDCHSDPEGLFSAIMDKLADDNKIVALLPWH